MATSLDDETQQPSFYNQLSSPAYGSSPPPLAALRTLPRAAPSSPIPESFVGGFLDQQLHRPLRVPARGDVEESIESLRESELDRSTEAVNAGNLLRVAPALAKKRPGWATSQLTEAGDAPEKSGEEEIDELESFPMPPKSPTRKPEESASVPSPSNSSPRRSTRAPVSRKRKDPPSPPSKRNTPVKSTAGQQPISAHSPARLNLTTTKPVPSRASRANPLPTPPITAVPLPPARPFSRTTSRSKRQKVAEQPIVQQSQDSFKMEAQRTAPREKPSAFFERLMSETTGLGIPKEMRSLNGSVHGSEVEDEEVPNTSQGDAADGGEEDQEMGDGTGKQGEEDEGEVNESVKDKVGGGGDDLDGIVVETHISSSSSGPRILIPASSDSSAKADVTAESALFSATESQPAPINETQQSSASLPSSSVPNYPPGQASQATSQSPVRPAENQDFSLFGRPRRGFTNVGLSQTQDDSPNSGKARPARGELFSSQGDGLGSSQGGGSQSQNWLSFQPTQVRASVDVGTRRSATQDSGLEPTQIVSEESHQRAQDVLAERRRREREEEEEERRGGGGNEGGYTQMSTQSGGTQDQPSHGLREEEPLEGTLQVSEESLERAQVLWQERMEMEARERRELEEATNAQLTESVPEESARSRVETQEATYQTRRSDDENTQLISAETQRRSAQTLARANTAHPTSIEPSVNPRVAPNRQLRRRNIQETQSAPQPLLAVPSLAAIVTSGRSRTDPVAQPTARLATPPSAPISRSRMLRRATPRRSPDEPPQIEVERGSPVLQGPSSSMQEAEDLLQLGVITQASNEARSQSLSTSPPIRASTRRTTKNRLRHSPSSSPSPPFPVGRRSSPLEFSQSHPKPPSKSRTPPVQEYEATFLNTETVQTLPEPTKPPSPVTTYGMRSRGANASPARPPPLAGRPVVEISPLKSVPRGRKRAAEDGEVEAPVTPKSGAKGRRKAAKAKVIEDDEESPDPLAAAADPEAGRRNDDRMEVDEPPEPESPPTPQDTEDFSYRPIVAARTSNTSITGKTGKKASAPTPAPIPRKSKNATTPIAGKKGRKVFSAITRFPKSAPSRHTSSTEVSTTSAPAPRKGKKGPRGSTSTALTAAPSEELSELSEPESPPTPQDPEDETFKVSKKPTKKRASRQNSTATSTSAGPSKARVPAKGRKGRNSKLSTTTADEIALPTPTYTSQRSTTERDEDEEDESEEEDISDRPLVFAYYKGNKSYYPCRVVARVGERYRVRYLDNDERIVDLDQIRRYELKAGDKVKSDTAFTKTKKKKGDSDPEVGQDWGDGDGPVTVLTKDGVLLGKFEIHLLKFSMGSTRFDDRKVTADMFEDVPEEEQDEEDIARSSASIVPKFKTGTTTFSDKIFMITPTDSSTSVIRDIIIGNGGKLCDWSELFAETGFGQPLSADIGRTPFLITPDIAGGTAGVKVKGMIALSFGIPCLAPEYVNATMAEPHCDWIPYAISTGTSAFTKQASLQFVDAKWGTAEQTNPWSIRKARHQRTPLADMRVLFLDLATNPKVKVADLEKIVGTCVFGLGAISFNTTTLSALGNIKDNAYDLLIVSNKASKKADELALEVKGNKKAGDVQWLKHCMVSGARPPMRLYSYESSK